MVYLYVVKVPNGRQSQMADGHLGLGLNVQRDLVDFKVCDWPLRPVSMANHKL